MSDTLKLENDSLPAENVVFSPTTAFSDTDLLNLESHRTQTGVLYTYVFYKKRKWKVPSEFLLHVDMEQIRTWWSDQTLLKFYPNVVDEPSTFSLVRILNKSNPFPQHSGIDWDEKFRGTLELEEV